ncbi:MAG TPA: hypothetical protein DCE56_13810 [Cyanobacteria bacterium UBA8553]|nr:hypothetical protein [Cyanobacteria bacterium UBA8553]
MEPMLLAAMSSENPALCREAIELGLITLSPAHMRALLVPLLKHPEPWVVEKAIEALGSIGNAENLDELLTYLKDSDFFPREEAYRTILRIAERHRLLGQIRLRLHNAGRIG